MGRKERQTDVFEMYVLLLADILCLFLSYLISLYLRFHAVMSIDEPNLHWTIFWGILVYSILYDSFVDYNRNFTKRGYYVEAKAIIKRNVIMAAGIGVVLFSFKQAENYSRLVYGYFMVADTLLTYAAHVGLKKYLRARMQNERHKVKIMVVTDNANVEELMDKLLKKAELYWDITSIAVMDDFCGEEIKGIPVVADRRNLMDVAKQMPIDEVFLYLPEEGRKQVDTIIMDFETMGVVCHYNIDVAGLSTKNSTVEEFGGFTVITYAENRIDYKRRMIKRLIDIAGSLIGLLITAVLFPFVAIAIKLDSKGPIFFAQTRIGKNGRRFKIYKFRSMYVDAEERKKDLEAQNEVQGLMFKMENDPRVTKVGRFLRKTSIDELPQFFNIVKGDMSLVGTRPPTEGEFEQYNSHYRRRISMTPGLTGLWQISGRSEIVDFDEVVKLDLEYIDNWTLGLDIKILFQTVWVVLTGRGSK